jgi:hypothetical protein
MTFVAFAIKGTHHGTGQHAENLPPTEISVGIKVCWAFWTRKMPLTIPVVVALRTCLRGVEYVHQSQHRHHAASPHRHPNAQDHHLDDPDYHRALLSILLLPLRFPMQTELLLLDAVRHSRHRHLHRSHHHGKRRLRLFGTGLCRRLDLRNLTCIPCLGSADEQAFEDSRGYDSGHGCHVGCAISCFKNFNILTPLKRINSNNNPHSLRPHAQRRRRLPLRNHRRRNLVLRRNRPRHHRRVPRDPPPSISHLARQHLLGRRVSQQRPQSLLRPLQQPARRFITQQRPPPPHEHRRGSRSRSGGQCDPQDYAG